MAATLLASIACVQAPRRELCPEVAVGELVITELHGKQEVGSDPKWIEIVNRSDHGVDLLGLHVLIQNLSGGTTGDGLVRYSHLLASGDYFVLGIVADMDLPEIIDYGLQGSHIDEGDTPMAESESGTGAMDTNEDTPPVQLDDNGGLLTLAACHVQIDHLVFPQLPTTGTRSLAGTPDAEANDEDAAWCIDDFMPTEGPMVEVGARGTPGEANRPCE